MENSSLKSKAIKGSIWSLIETFSLQIVQLIVGIILARLLDPKDYGLIALTAIFSGITAAITDGGFEKSLIRKKELSSVEINTVFYLNLFLGAFMALGFIIAAPLFATFFHSPDFTTVFRVVAIGFFLNSLGQTQRILLMKDLLFKKISYAQIASSVIGGIAGVIMAYRGFGVWALALSGLITQVVRVSFFWIRSHWYPKLEFSISSIRGMLPYGINILFSSILLFFVQQFNNLVVGRFYTKSDLGLFNRGSRFPDLVVTIIQSVILKMSFPLFSKMQDNPPQLKSALRKSMKLIAFIAFPLLTIMLVNAEDITIVLFTEKWRNSIVFFQLFCVVRLVDPFITINKELILAKGYSKLLLNVFIITSVFEMCLVLFFIKHGIEYIVMVTFISKILQYIIYSSLNYKKNEIGIFEQLRWISPYMLVVIVVGCIELLCNFYLKDLHYSMLIKLIFKMFIGGATYLLLSVVSKFDEMTFFKSAYSILGSKMRLIRQ